MTEYKKATNENNMGEFPSIAKMNKNMPTMAEALKAIEDALNITNQLVISSNQEISVVKKETKSNSKRLDFMEKQAPISRRQADIIKARVKDLARELVGYPSKLYSVTIADIYRYLRTYHNLAQAVADTEKQYINEVFKGLEHYKDNSFDIKRLVEHKKSLDLKN